MKKNLRRYNVILISILLRLFSYRTKGLYFNRTLVLAPHPDDEVLGLGGIMMNLLTRGGEVSILYLTDGEGSGVWSNIEDIRRQRIQLSEKSAARLGINNSNIYRLHLPDGNIPRPGKPGFEEAVSDVKDLINSLKPDTVFATHPLDYWPFDHVACAEIASEAIKLSDHKPQLWYYWVWAWYNLRPWKLSVKRLKKLQKIDINKQLLRKKELLDIYLEPLTSDGKPWSGIIPKSLLKAVNYPFEIVERVL